MKKIIAIIILSIVSLGAINAQSADEIVTKYINAMGGVDKMKAVKSKKSTMVLNQNGVQLPGIMLGDENNRQRTELTYGGMKMIQAYDGTTAWARNDFGGMTTPTVLEGDDAKAVSEDEFLNAFVDYKQRGSSLEYKGEEDFAGVSCHKLIMTKSSGSQSIHYFDKTSGLQKGQTQTTGGMQVVIEFDDYKETNGVMTAMKMTQKVSGQVLVFVISKVEHNIALTDDMFAFPGK